MVGRHFLLVPLLIGLAGCGREAERPPPPRPVATLVVAPAQGETLAFYPGEIVSRYEVRLGFRVAGRLTAKLVDIGDRVSAGQALAELDPGDAQLNLNSAEGQASAAASTARQQALDLARDRELLKEGFISQTEFDRQKVSTDQAQAQLRTARSQHAEAARQLGYTVLRAERAGVVTAFSGDVGQVVQAGQAIATVSAPGTVEAAISIPEGQVESFRRAGLRVRLWSAPNVAYPGRIRTLSPAADQQTRTFDARVAFTAPPGAAPLGATAEVETFNPLSRALLRVPVSALSQRGGQTVVWVVSGAPARVAPRPVQVVLVQQNAVLISGGLHPGERVVTAGVHLLHPGQIVLPVGQSGDVSR